MLLITPLNKYYRCTGVLVCVCSMDRRTFSFAADQISTLIAWTENREQEWAEVILDMVMNFLYLLCQPDADSFRNERTSLREWRAGSDSSGRLKLLHFLRSKMENIKHESKRSPPSFYSDFISGIISLSLWSTVTHWGWCFIRSWKSQQMNQ